LWRPPRPTRFPYTTLFRSKALQVPVTIGSVKVCPGDIVRGDADGVVVLPQAQVPKLLDIAEDITQKESRLRDDIRNGVRLDEARDRKSTRLNSSHVKISYA